MTDLSFLPIGVPLAGSLCFRNIHDQPRVHGGKPPKKKKRYDAEAQRRNWLGLTDPVLAPPAALPTQAIRRAPRQVELHAVVRLRLRSSVAVSTELAPQTVNRLAFSTQAGASAELNHEGKPAAFTLRADTSKVVSETTVSGGGGFKFGSKHRVETDLWLDRPLTDDERLAVLAKLKP